MQEEELQTKALLKSRMGETSRGDHVEIFTYFATLPHLVAEKGTNPSSEADIIIASKICPTSSSSIPPSWLM
jgi:hypothetical protein